jgi:hypothetical protein
MFFFFPQGWRTIALRDPNEDPNLLRLDFWRFFRLIFSVHRKDATTAPLPPTSCRPNPTARAQADASSDGAGAAGPPLETPY